MSSSSSSSGGGLSQTITAINKKQSINDIKDWDNKRVLMRVDYNVKVKGGKVQDKTRIEATLDTIKFIMSHKIKCLALVTHLGRPQPGAPSFNPAEFTLEPVAKSLQEYLPQFKIVFINETVGERVEKALAAAEPNTIFMLENVRYHAEETGIRFAAGEGDGAKPKKIKVTYAEKAAFRAQLSRLADVFIFEAFGCCHRPHSSVIGVDCTTRVAGLLMHREMATFGKVLSSPERPFVAIVGGAKVSDKILVLENLLDLVDELIIGGGMAYTFKKVINGIDIGNSLFDEPGSKIVHKLVEKARAKNVQLHLPIDHIIGDKFAADAKVGVTDDKTGIPKGWMGLDIGPASRTIVTQVLQRARTIVWNGPLGVFEFGAFSAGTVGAMYDLVAATQRGATTVIGGGDTATAAKQIYVGHKLAADQITHLSTGGGASLELIEGKLLPGVVYLSNKGEHTPNPPNEATEPVAPDDD